MSAKFIGLQQSNNAVNLKKKYGKSKLLPHHLKPIEKCFKQSELPCEDVPKLKQVDVDWYRLQFHENIYLNLIKNGYHRTFSELFYLINFQENRRLQAGVSSPLWNLKPLSKREDVLVTMVNHLICAEIAQISHDFNRVYCENLSVAQIFRQNENDFWLLEYYLEKCLSTIQKGLKYIEFLMFREKQNQIIDDKIMIKNENVYKSKFDQIKLTVEKREVEAIFHLAMFLNMIGKNEESLIRCYDLYGKLKKHPDYLSPPTDPLKENDEIYWKTAPLLKRLTCEKIAQNLLAIMSTDTTISSDEKLTHFNEALKYANESENQRLIGDCKYHLSKQYIVNNQLDLAYTNAEEFYNISQILCDTSFQLKACKLMAIVNQSKSEMQKAEFYLIELIDLASQENNSLLSAESYELLARFYITQTKEFDKANEAAENGLKYAMNSSNQFISHKLKVWCSLAKSQIIQANFTSTLLSAEYNQNDLFDLLKWRDERIDLPLFDETQFSKSTYKSFTQRLQQIKMNKQNIIEAE